MQQTRTPPQTKQILNYLLSGKSITPIEALNLFGCFRLSGRIFEIKHELGYPVKSEPFRTETGKNSSKVFNRKINKKMALRNQPYLPLYVNDFLSDEKLMQCSAEATGVYIRLLCIMHKSEKYGKILLKQIQKQSKDNLQNFASVITKQMPYEFPLVKRSLVELLSYNIIAMENDELIQKRMVKDNEISDVRAFAGKNGGKKTQKKNKDFALAKALAKSKANSEYEYESENEVENNSFEKDIGGLGGKEKLFKIPIMQSLTRSAKIS